MKLVAKTLYGLEPVLSEELERLGARDVKPLNRAVLFRGDRELLYRVNYCSRTALSVLMPVAEFRIGSKNDLYKRSLEIPWDNYLDPDSTFSVVPVVNSPWFDHSGYAGLVLKDAVADYFRKRSGRRPSVDANDPAVVINLHISHESVTVSLDSSVVPLFKRGYRKEQSVAPLNEVLAAGMVLLSGWDASTALTDPMCGSGTIPIEAGLIACNIPPGKFRKFFGFERWRDFDPELFDKIRSESELAVRKPAISIRASDILEEAANQTRINAASAGLGDVITVETGDFRNMKATEDRGCLFLNPPYGQRIKPDEIDSLYSMIGTTLKHNFPGHEAWLISSNEESLKHIGLKPSRKYSLFNGALQCTLLKYEMYHGSKKINTSADLSNS